MLVGGCAGLGEELVPLIYRGGEAGACEEHLSPVPALTPGAHACPTRSHQHQGAGTFMTLKSSTENSSTAADLSKEN